MDAAELAQTCRDVKDAAGEALAWARDPANEPRLRSERPALERSIQRNAIAAERLERAATRPMCVGIFGPSQHGKSYLVSVLASAAGQLKATFQGQLELDFLGDINPSGGKESTGLVTRFTMARPAAPAGYPVVLRLLDEADLVKLFANSYHFDGDDNAKATPSPQDVASHLAQFKGDALSPPTSLRPEDVWDIETYLENDLWHAQQQDQSIARTNLMTSLRGSWDEIGRLAVGLPLERRGKLFSILWGGHESYTGIYVKLAAALGKLSNAKEIFAPISALVPREKSIIDVSALAQVSTGGGEPITVSLADGRTAEIGRALLTALTAELVISLRDRPSEMFDHTDLLDFPGYRSRERYDLARGFANDTAKLDVLLLRSKVHYLFQRYTREKELTSMILCVRDVQVEVLGLPEVVEDWVLATHGEPDAGRLQRPTLLFFCLTFFDQHFGSKAGESQDNLGEIFQTRLKASLLEKFDRGANPWPSRWAPNESFKNCFWVRNPNVHIGNAIVFDYDSDNRETEIKEGQKGRIAGLKTGHGTNEVVRAHFAEPDVSFDAVMKPNDGGVSFLVSRLSPVCNPRIKLDLVARNIAEVRGKLVTALRHHFVPTESGALRTQRKAVLEKIGPALIECDSRNRFGSLVRRLGVETVSLKQSIYRARLDDPAPAPAPAAGTPAAAAAAPAPRRAGRLDRRFGPGNGGETPAAAASPRTSPASQNAASAALAAMQLWSSNLLLLADDAVFARTVGLGVEAIREIVNELIAAARRQKLEQKITEGITAVVFATDDKELFANKSTIVAQRLIGRFVSSFGAVTGSGPVEKVLLFDGALEPVFAARGDVKPEDLPAAGLDFQIDYLSNWVFSMENSMRAEAEGGQQMSLEERAQNQRLGTVLDRLADEPRVASRAA